MKEKLFSTWRKYLCLNLTFIFLLSVTCTLSAAGQQITVRGTVTDATTGDAMPGVNVVVSGSTIGAMTGVSGEYTLEVPNASATLQFSFVGYVTQNVALNGKTTLNIAMTADVAQLSEVVVVGYGTQLKKDLTGSVARVESAKLLDKPAFNIAQALGGKIAGVKIIEANGAPGGNPMIRVRGTNSIYSSMRQREQHRDLHRGPIDAALEQFAEVLEPNPLRHRAEGIRQLESLDEGPDGGDEEEQQQHDHLRRKQQIGDVFFAEMRALQPALRLAVGMPPGKQSAQARGACADRKDSARATTCLH